MTVIDDYIEGFAGRQRDRLNQLATLLRELVPEATERISYQLPTFYLNGNLVHFGGFAHHTGFYPGADGVAAFEDELGDYVHAKGSIQFPLDQPLPLDLISRITLFRVSQQRQKGPRRRRPDA